MSFMIKIDGLDLIDHDKTIEFNSLGEVAIKIAGIVTKHPEFHVSYTEFKQHNNASANWFKHASERKVKIK